MKTSLFLIFICFFYNCKTQKLYKPIPQEFYQFSIASGIILKKASNATDDYSTLFRIKELISSDSIMAQQYGIYELESFSAESKKGIIFKMGDSYELYDMSNFGFFMPRLLSFLNDTMFSLSNDLKLKYIKEVVGIYKERSESRTDMIIKENHGRFNFYIDPQNYHK